eukprot:UC4_evm1s1364
MSANFFSRLSIGLATITTASAANAAGGKATTVASFSNPHMSVKEKIRSWMVVNDTVMGGRSTSKCSTMEPGSNLPAVFEGELNLEGGGFVSCRADTTSDLEPSSSSSPYGEEKIVISVTGDGQRYKVTLRTAKCDRATSYRHDFDTIQSQRTTHTLRIEDFQCAWRGRLIQDAPKISLSEVNSIGIMLSFQSADGNPNPNFHDGPFKI